MDDIDRIRRFNRQWTARVGLLDRSYLKSGMSMAEVRVLHDLGDAPVSAAALGNALALDPGYLSRILSKFRREHWLESDPVPGDARARILSLTEAGKARLAEMKARSRHEVRAALAHLPKAALSAMADRMDDIAALAAPDHVSDVTLRDLAPGDAGWVVEAHGALYARDEGFDTRFEALVARIVADFLERHDPATERGWIAFAGHRRVGCIFCVQSDEGGVAKLRLFLTLPEARGQGLGRRLLRTCRDFAREAGYSRLRLWTHAEHRAACALYASEGFDLVSSRPVTSFGKALTEQVWEIALTPQSA